MKWLAHSLSRRDTDGVVYDETVGGRHVVASLLLCACKAQLGDGGASFDVPTPDAATVAEIDAAMIDAPVMLGAWSAAEPVPGASSGLGEDDCTMSSNKRELYFKRNDSGNNNLYVMTRANPADAWSMPSPLTILNTGGTEESPRLSRDDLTMYFGRDGQIYKSTRANVGSDWGMPTEVTSLNTTAYEKWADVCDNGYAIVSRDTTNNGQDLFEGTITGGATTPLDDFNTTSAEQGTLLSADCLRVYFQSNRDGQFNIYSATRQSLTSAWSNPTALADFNTTQYSEEDPWISADERTFVFASNKNGNKDLFISTR